MSEIRNRRRAGNDHEVVTVVGGGGSYRRTPCGPCPWVVENTGEFPAEAFRHSAHTANDLSQAMFGCHDHGSAKPVTCAGFLLRGADHNMTVRMRLVERTLDLDAVHDDGRELHHDYVTMAVANGVPADDPALAECRRRDHE